jgi:hypothetical protein
VTSSEQPTDGLSESRSSLLTSLLSLLASSSTLVCCALPALLVALGAGAALSSLVSSVPQLVWLSEYKTGVFALAGLLLVASGALQWRNRFAPCPVDFKLRQACLRTRQTARGMWLFSVAVYAVGGVFAFVLPWWLALA